MNLSIYLGMFAFCSLWMLNLVIGASYTENGVTQYPSSATSRNIGCFPNIYPKPVAFDWDTNLGVWYEYARQGSSDYNAVVTNNLIGRTWLPGTAIPVHDINQRIAFSTVNGSNVSCDAFFFQFFGRPDGIEQDLGFSPGTNANPTPAIYYHIYHTSELDVNYACLTPNFDTGVCEKTDIGISIRTRPDKLSEQQKTATEAAINEVFAPYCITLNDLGRAAYRDDLPACDPQPPAAYTNLILGFNTSLPNRPAEASSRKFTN